MKVRAARMGITSRQLAFFEPTSVVVVVVVAFYVAMQFLFALFRSVRGLSTRGDLAPVIAAFSPDVATTPPRYLAMMCGDLARRIEQHRETTNDKFSQLRAAHRSLLNAVVGLLVAILALGTVVLSESLK